MSAKTQGARAGAKGHSVKGQSARGQSAKGQSAKGETSKARAAALTRPTAKQTAKPVAKHTSKSGTTGVASAKVVGMPKTAGTKTAGTKTAGTPTQKAAAMASKGLATKKVSAETGAKRADGAAVARGKAGAAAGSGRGSKSEPARAAANARKATAPVTSAKREGATSAAAKSAVAEHKSSRKVTVRAVPTAETSTKSEKTKAGLKQQHVTPAGGQKEKTKLTTKAKSPAAASETSTGVHIAERAHTAAPQLKAEKTDTKKTDVKKASPAVAKAPQSAAAAAFVAARKKMAAAAKPSLIVGKKSEAAGGGEQVAQDSVKKVDEKPAAPAATPRPANEAARAPGAVKTGAPPFAMTRPGALPSERVAKAKPGAKPPSFKALEYVVYPAHGVGQITAIESQEVAGYKLELYVISFVKDKMILKVPLPKIVSVGLRKLAEPPVMKRALDTLTGRARIKRTMWSRRAQEYEAKINSGDLIAIAEVVRDLYRSDAQPEQSYSERQLYEAALDRMAREISAVQELTDTEALKIIDEQLQKGPRRGKAEEADNDDSEDENAGIDEAA